MLTLSKHIFSFTLLFSAVISDWVGMGLSIGVLVFIHLANKPRKQNTKSFTK